MNIKTIFILIALSFSLIACDKKPNSKIEVWALDELRAEFMARDTNLDQLCLSDNNDKKTLAMCEDIAKAKALREKILLDDNYEFFIDCAKNYSETMTKMVERMKELDPEGYKELHFGDEKALYRYLVLPETTRVMATCEDHAEKKYWGSLIKKGLKSDLEFCVEVMNKCVDETDSPCPKNKDDYLKECSAKLKAII